MTGQHFQLPGRSHRAALAAEGPRAASRRGIERASLPNGLRVVMNVDRSVGLVSVAVCYGVGSRAEPRGRTGLAHLFEHLMFQGSGSIGKMGHVHEIEGAGGLLNAAARPDYTNYWQTVPPSALARVLFLEADRMKGPLLGPEPLANQVDVVKEEIRVNVRNRPYGSFPWFSVPQVLFDTFPNAHNTYGDEADLDGVTVADAQRFFDRHYRPANAVVTITGDFDPGSALRIVHRYFGAIPGRSEYPKPPPDRHEPPMDCDRQASLGDPRAPAPAVALAWRLSVEPTDVRRYLAFVLLARILAGDRRSRLHQRLIDQLQVTRVAGEVGFDERDPFDVLGPVALTLHGYVPLAGQVERVVAAMEEEVERLAEDGLNQRELQRAQASLEAELYGRLDCLEQRAVLMGFYELETGRPQWAVELPALPALVTANEVKDAAGLLQRSCRARLDLIPGVRA